MWIYAQKTGHLFRQDHDDLRFVAKGYSGRGSAMNDPASQCVKDFGPLPRGDYTFAAPTTFNFMADCLRLVPLPNNAMCNPARAGFWIHDGIFSGPHGDSSHGCICVPRSVRQLMWASQDHMLRVVAQDPGPQVQADADRPPRAMSAALVSETFSERAALDEVSEVRADALAPDAPAPDAPRTFTLRQGHRYRATVTLGGFEAFASNGTLVDMLHRAGFRDVTVTGEGRTRVAQGSWQEPDLVGPVDPHLGDIAELASA